MLFWDAALAIPYHGGSLERDALLSNRNLARRCHGPKYGIEENLVVKRLGEKCGRTILHGHASDGVLIVRRNDDDARLGRNRAQLLLEFAHWLPPSEHDKHTRRNHAAILDLSGICHDFWQNPLPAQGPNSIVNSSSKTTLRIFP